MAIEQNRIEAAARAMMSEPELWDISTESYRDEWRDRAFDVLNAAYPELASDPPKAWVAPWTPTGAMIGATVEAVDRSDGYSGPVRLNYAEVEDVFEAARDAHLKEQGHE